MKKFILLPIIIIAALFGIAALLPGPVVPWRVQSDIVLNADGSAKSATVDTFFHQVYSDGTTNVVNDLGKVSWDAVANASKTVTVGDKTYTYGEALSVVIAIATQERSQQNP